MTDLAENMVIMKKELKDMKQSTKSLAAKLGQRKCGAEQSVTVSSSKKIKPVAIFESDTSESECETDSDGFAGLNSLIEGEKPEEKPDEEEVPSLLNPEYDDITSEEEESNYEKIKMDVKKYSRDHGDVNVDDIIVISDSDKKEEI